MIAGAADIIAEAADIIAEATDIIAEAAIYKKPGYLSRCPRFSFLVFLYLPVLSCESAKIRVSMNLLPEAVVLGRALLASALPVRRLLSC